MKFFFVFPLFFCSIPPINPIWINNEKSLLLKSNFNLLSLKLQLPLMNSCSLQIIISLYIRSSIRVRCFDSSRLSVSVISLLKIKLIALLCFKFNFCVIVREFWGIEPWPETVIGQVGFIENKYRQSHIHKLKQMLICEYYQLYLALYISKNWRIQI